MSDGAIFLSAIFLIVLRLIYMLAIQQRKVKLGRISDREPNPLDSLDPKNHGLMPGDVGYNPFDTHRN